MIPYLVLIGAAIFLQYYQMKQMNSRNPGAAQANPQMQTMQKFFPLIFGVIYLRVPAGATIYMVVSSAMRIGTQELMFRTGMVTPVAAEREIGGASKSGGSVKSKEIAPAPKPAPKAKTTVVDGTATGAKQGTTPPPRTSPSTSANGRNGNSHSDGESEEAQAAKAHPRSKSKRTRKAR
jgi:hypothetical protein